MKNSWRFFFVLTVAVAPFSLLAEEAAKAPAIVPPLSAETAKQPESTEVPPTPERKPENKDKAATPILPKPVDPKTGKATDDSSQIPTIMNLDEIAKALKVADFKGKKFARKIKVAVLDNGFRGYEAEIGKSLPAGTQYHSGAASKADNQETSEFHGLFMAQIMAGIIAKSGAEADYELHLFNSYGITKLTDAVNNVVSGGFDVVLYSQVWEYGGNGDGKGFINTLINKALAAGVVWINAAGNFGHLTKRAPVEAQGEWVTFKNKKGKAGSGVTILCKVKAKETCNLRLALSWNDFKDETGIGTDKDLDLFLYDSKNKKIESSELNQKVTIDANDTKSSLYPREYFGVALKPGSYTAKVKVKSKNFSAGTDQLRITSSGKGIEMADASVGETLLPPADNDGVIVVGAADDFQSSRSDSLKKPDINVKSLVKLKDGSEPYSTSNAAAMVAAVTVLELGTGTNKNKETLLASMKDLSKPLPTMVASKPAKPKAVASNKQGRPRYSEDYYSPRAPYDDGYDRAGSGYEDEYSQYEDPRYEEPYDDQVDRGSYDGGGYAERDARSIDDAYRGNGNYQVPGGRQVPGADFDPTRDRDPSYQARHCLVTTALPEINVGAQQVLAMRGATPAILNGRYVIAVKFDAAALFVGTPQALLPRGARLFATPQGVMVLRGEQILQGLPFDYLEIIQLRRGSVGFCRSAVRR